MDVKIWFIRCVKREHAKNVITMLVQCFERFSYLKIKTSPFKNKNDIFLMTLCKVVVLAGRNAVLFYSDFFSQFFSTVLFCKLVSQLNNVVM